MRSFRNIVLMLGLALFLGSDVGTIANADTVTSSGYVTYKTKKAIQEHKKDPHQGTTMVWIAPISGTKYHYLHHSQHFGHSKKRKIVTLKWAKEHGYTLGK